MANHNLEGQGGGPLLWAPVASAHASAGFGLMTTPEVGDEVLVGFLDSDPERPAVLGSVWNGAHAGPRERYESEHEAELAGNQVKRIVTKSGIRIHITDTPGKQAISIATPRSNHLLLSEQVSETGRPAIVLHTLGDIHLSSGGRIHRQSLTHSHHVDGKIMHSIALRVVTDGEESSPYETELLSGQLTDGSQPRVQHASGQSFPAIPAGSCKFHLPNFYDDVTSWEWVDTHA